MVQVIQKIKECMDKTGKDSMQVINNANTTANTNAVSATSGSK